MKLLIGFVFILVAPLSSFADDKSDTAKELKALEGKWKAVSMEAGRTVLSKDSTPEFVFTVSPNGKSRAKTPQHDDQDHRDSQQPACACARESFHHRAAGILD